MAQSSQFPSIETILDQTNFSTFHEEIEQMTEKKQIKLKNEEYNALTAFRLKLLEFYQDHKETIQGQYTIELQKLEKELYQMLKQYKDEILSIRAKHLKTDVPEEMGELPTLNPLPKRKIRYTSTLKERYIAGDDFKREVDRLPQKFQELLKHEIEEINEARDQEIQAVKEKKNQERDYFWRSLDKLGKGYEQKKVAIQEFDAAEVFDIKTVLRRYEGNIIKARMKYIELSQLPNTNEANAGANVGVNALTNDSDARAEKEKERMLNSDKLYTDAIIQEKIKIPFNKMSNNMTRFFENYAEKMIECKCRNEGYVRMGSCSVLSYSTGLLNSDSIIYNVIYSVNVCYPYENMEVECKIKNITKIGIRAIISEQNNPIILFISREHNPDKDFDQYKENQIIKVKILGHRFELNDQYISVIGELID